MVGRRSATGCTVRRDEAAHSDVVLVRYAILTVEGMQIGCAQACGKGHRLSVGRQRAKAGVALGHLVRVKLGLGTPISVRQA